MCIFSSYTNIISCRQVVLSPEKLPNLENILIGAKNLQYSE